MTKWCCAWRHGFILGGRSLIPRVTTTANNKFQWVTWTSSSAGFWRLLIYYTIKVSWVRHNDLSLLTVGRYTYISDLRFSAVHDSLQEDWKLQIERPAVNDTGIYECQISTTPPMSLQVNLTVLREYTYIYTYFSSLMMIHFQPHDGHTYINSIFHWDPLILAKLKPSNCTEREVLDHSLQSRSN